MRAGTCSRVASAKICSGVGGGRGVLGRGAKRPGGPPARGGPPIPGPRGGGRDAAPGVKPGAGGPDGRGGAEGAVAVPAVPTGPGAGRGGGADGATDVDGRGVGARPLGRGAGDTPGVGRGAGVAARGAPSALVGAIGADGATGVGRGVGLGVGEGVGAVEDGVTGPPGVEPGLRMTSTAGSTRRVFLSFTVVRYLMRESRACPGSRLGGC